MKNIFNSCVRLCPRDVINTLERFELSGQYEAPEYQRVMVEQVYRKHLCRLDPWPEPVVRTFRNLNKKIYNYMQGQTSYL